MLPCLGWTSLQLLVGCGEGWGPALTQVEKRASHFRGKGTAPSGAKRLRKLPCLPGWCQTPSSLNAPCGRGASSAQQAQLPPPSPLSVACLGPADASGCQRAEFTVERGGHLGGDRVWV